MNAPHTQVYVNKIIIILSFTSDNLLYAMFLSLMLLNENIIWCIFFIVYNKNEINKIHL